MARKNTTLFARLSLDYADHPKIQALSDAAFRAHVEMILYSRRYLTDGRIPNRVANRFGCDSLTELTTNDEERPSLAQDEHGDYWLHGYADMQETREEVEAKRLVNATNGRRGGRTAKRTGTESLTQSQTDSGSEKKAETETETETDIKRGETSAQTGGDAPLPVLVDAPATDVAPPQKPKRGTRIPDDFQPSRTPGNTAAESGHEAEWLRDQLQRFCDHWAAQPGAKGVKADWDATWRNWIRRSADFAPTARPRTAASMSATDWDRIMAEAKAQDERNAS